MFAVSSCCTLSGLCFHFFYLGSNEISLKHLSTLWAQSQTGGTTMKTSHSFMSLKQVYREVQVHLWVYGNVVKTTLPVDLKLFYFEFMNFLPFY